ncbi:oligosaccharide flippase family protein [Morganella morganii]|uniref:oligosaccharide flippase family protein n=1 Tax=Morganella morganii TaxID=582 RepID=UPI0030A66D21
MKILKNILWLMTEKGSQILIGIFISGLLARNLGVVDFGYFQYTISMILLFSSLTFICGSEVVVPKLVTSSKSERNSIITNCFLLRIIASTVGCLLFILYLYHTDIGKEYTLSIFLLALIILFREPFNTTVSILQSECNEKIAVWIRIIALLTKLILLIIVYSLGYLNFQFTSILWLFECLLIASILVIIFKRIEPNYCFSFEKRDFFKLLNTGIKFWLGIMLMYLFLRIDRIFIMYTLSPAILGTYSAATQITDNMLTVAPIIAISAAPLLIYNKFSKKDIIRNVTLLTCVMAAIGFLIAIIGYFLSPLMISIIFGSSYDDSTRILQYLFLLCIPIFIDAGLNTLIIKNGNGYIIMAKWTIALLIAITFNFIFIHKLGLTAIIVSNFLGYSSAVIFGLIYIINQKNKVITK